MMKGTKKYILTFGNWQLLTLFLKGARVDGMGFSRTVIIIEVNSWFLAWSVQGHIGCFRSMFARREVCRICRLRLVSDPQQR